MAIGSTSETTTTVKANQAILNPRFFIALGVLLASIGAVLALAYVGMRDATDNAGKMQIMNIVLPLFATWVGTILAYYFSGENFELANRSVREMAKQLTPTEKLASIPVKARMIHFGKMEYIALSANNTVEQIKIVGDILAFFDSKTRNRLPILDDQSHPKYILHRSMVDKYLTRKATQLADGGPNPIPQLTFSNLLTEDPELRIILEQGFAVVGAKDTLGDAKDAMDNIENCSDVFVTDTGTRDGKVLGWITNLIITENAKL